MYLLQIWVSSPHNASGYYGLKEEINDALSKEHFQAILSGAGDTSVQYARTGYLGFMIKAEDNAKSKGAFMCYLVLLVPHLELGFSIISLGGGGGGGTYMACVLCYECRQF